MGTIAEKITYLEGTKSAIKDAIIAKGVKVSDTDVFRSYAEKIKSIETGGSCKSQSKELTITDNGTRVVTPDEGYLLNQVTVTTYVTTGKPELPNGISFEGSTWTTFDTDPYDWSQVYSGTNMFYDCKNLQTLTGSGLQNVYFLDLYSMFYSCSKLNSILKLSGKPYTLERCFWGCYNLVEPDLSGLDFSNTVNIDSAFYNTGNWAQNIDMSTAPIIIANSAYASSKIDRIPKINYSKIELCSNMFEGCNNLTSVTLNLPNVITMDSMFKNCSNLGEVHFTGLGYCVSMQALFYNCQKLVTVSGLNCSNVTSLTNTFTDCPALVNIDGLFNLGEGVASNTTFDISLLQSLSRESYLNIFNTIYDFVGNGSSIRCVLDVHPNAFTILSEEDIAIATAKG